MNVTFSLGLGARRVVDTVPTGWVLSSGFWNDTLAWADSENWID